MGIPMVTQKARDGWRKRLSSKSTNTRPIMAFLTSRFIRSLYISEKSIRIFVFTPGGKSGSILLR